MYVYIWFVCTFGLCVHSYRDAHYKQTFASMSFQTNKVFFHLFTEKYCTQSKEKVHFHPSSSPQQHLGISTPLLDHVQHSFLSQLFLGGWLRSKRGSCPSERFSLQCISLATQHFPTEGPPNAQIISLFSFPAKAFLLLAVEKPSFLESIRFLIKIGIPVKEGDPDQALPFYSDFHPSLGNSPSWKYLDYKYSPTNSLWYFSLYYINFLLPEIIPMKSTTEHKLGKAALRQRSSMGCTRQSTGRAPMHTLALIATSWADLQDCHITCLKDSYPSATPLCLVSFSSRTPCLAVTQGLFHFASGGLGKPLGGSY